MNEFTPTHCPFCTRRIKKAIAEIDRHAKCCFCKNNDQFAFQVTMATQTQAFITLRIRNFKVVIDYFLNQTIIYNNLSDLYYLIKLDFTLNYFEPEALTRAIQTYLVFQ